MLRRLGSETILSKGEEDNLCLLLIWKLVGKVGNTQKYVSAHITNIPEIHNRNPTCLWLMETAWETGSCSMDWACSLSTKLKYSSYLSSRKVKILVVLSGPTAKSTCMRVGNIPQWRVPGKLEIQAGNGRIKAWLTWRHRERISGDNSLWKLNYLSLVEGYACWLLKRQWNMEYSPFFPRGLGGQELTST